MDKIEEIIQNNGVQSKKRTQDKKQAQDIGKEETKKKKKKTYKKRIPSTEAIAKKEEEKREKLKKLREEQKKYKSLEKDAIKVMEVYEHNERLLRIHLAIVILRHGQGNISKVSNITGVARSTLYSGLREIYLQKEKYSRSIQELVVDYMERQCPSLSKSHMTTDAIVLKNENEKWQETGDNKEKQKKVTVKYLPKSSDRIRVSGAGRRRIFEVYPEIEDIILKILSEPKKYMDIIYKEDAEEIKRLRTVGIHRERKKKLKTPRSKHTLSYRNITNILYRFYQIKASYLAVKHVLEKLEREKRIHPREAYENHLSYYSDNTEEDGDEP